MLFQTKEQDRTPEKVLKEMETSNLPDKGFKTAVIRKEKHILGFRNGKEKKRH